MNGFNSKQTFISQCFHCISRHTSWQKQNRPGPQCIFHSTITTVQYVRITEACSAQYWKKKLEIIYQLGGALLKKLSRDLVLVARRQEEYWYQNEEKLAFKFFSIFRFLGCIKTLKINEKIHMMTYILTKLCHSGSTSIDQSRYPLLVLFVQNSPFLMHLEWKEMLIPHKAGWPDSTSVTAFVKSLLKVKN